MKNDACVNRITGGNVAADIIVNNSIFVHYHGHTIPAIFAHTFDFHSGSLESKLSAIILTHVARSFFADLI